MRLATTTGEIERSEVQRPATGPGNVENGRPAADGDGIHSRAVIADVTGLLQAWSSGDAEALEQLAPLVQRELREMARRMLAGEPQAVGWQPTDLVQESTDRQEILYVDLQGRLRGRPVRYQSDGTLALGAAASLNVPLIGAGHWGTQYDVSPDGQHVHFIDRTPAPRPSDIHGVLGWRALVK